MDYLFASTNYHFI